MGSINFKDFYKVPELKFDISKLRKDLDSVLKKKQFATPGVSNFGAISLNQIPNDENSIISHLNNDHKDVIITTLKGVYNIYDKNVEVLGLSIDGYYLKTNNEILYIPFDYPCENSKQIRDEFINHAKKFKI